MNYKKLLIIAFFLLVSSMVLYFYNLPDNKLHIIACDVGQGDAILVTYKSFQILIDGGPNDKVIGCLSRHMAYWDKTIEVVISTHPESDHYRGLISVVKNYKVLNFLVNPVDNPSSQNYEVLTNTVGGYAVNVVNPTAGMVIRYGLISLDIVHPSKEFLKTNLYEKDSNKIPVGDNLQTKKIGYYQSILNPNDFSIVSLLSFNKFEALFTGDAPEEISDEVLFRLKDKSIDYIKIPHHGSKNALTWELIPNLNPKVAVISVGKNSYGHPNTEIIDLLKKYNVSIYQTIEMGDVEVVSDGFSWKVVD